MHQTQGSYAKLAIDFLEPIRHYHHIDNQAGQ